MATAFGSHTISLVSSSKVHSSGASSSAVAHTPLAHTTFVPVPSSSTRMDSFSSVEVDLRELYEKGADRALFCS
jgi:hypothetical protein